MEEWDKWSYAIFFVSLTSGLGGLFFSKKKLLRSLAQNEQTLKVTCWGLMCVAPNGFQIWKPFGAKKGYPRNKNNPLRACWLALEVHAISAGCIFSRLPRPWKRMAFKLVINSLGLPIKQGQTMEHMFILYVYVLMISICFDRDSTMGPQPIHPMKFHQGPFPNFTTVHFQVW